MRSTQRKRSSQACTTCRQAKLRCDTSVIFPRPCSRCAATGRACTFDPSFKRTPARGQLEKVKHQLHELQQILAVSEPAGQGSECGSKDEVPSDRSHISNVNFLNRPELPSGILSPEAGVVDDMFGLQGPQAPVVEQSCLGTVTLMPEDILTLFSFFSEIQYHHFPVLDPPTPIGAIQRESPLLFWTIIVAASRYHDEYLYLIPSLRDAYHDLLGRALSSFPLTHDTVEALLLLCHWNFPCTKQSEDPSWSYCGLLINTLSQEFGFPHNQRWTRLPAAEQRKKARTWVGCFYISTVLSSNQGCPPPMQSATHIATLTYLTKVAQFPDAFATQIEIQKHVAKYKAFLGADQPSISISMIRHFEHDLNEISTRFQQTWTLENEFSLLYAKMNLYVLACAHHRRANQAARPMADGGPNDTSLFWLEGIYRACKLIHTCSAMLNIQTQSSQSHNVKKCSYCTPKHYLVSMSAATFFLLDSNRFNIQLSAEDSSMVLNHIGIAHDLYTRISKEPLDEAGRTARGIKLISEAGRAGARSKNHHSASIITDVLEELPKLREKYSDQSGSVHIGVSAAGENTSQELPTDVMLGDDIGFFPDLSNWLDLESWVSNIPMSTETWDFTGL